MSLAHAAVTHLHFSLFTSLLDYPDSINVLDNASFPLLGILMAPVTAVVGPVGTLVILFRLSFFLSAVACFLALRRFICATFAAGVGGGLYPFSPYMTHQSARHFFLVFGPLPPLMLLLMHRQLAGPGHIGGRTTNELVTSGLIARSRCELFS